MIYEATLKTLTSNSLEPEVEKYRGEKIILLKWWHAWEGPYWGQECYIATPYIGWIPECELEDMKEISWKDLGIE